MATGRGVSDESIPRSSSLTEDPDADERSGPHAMGIVGPMISFGGWEEDGVDDGDDDDEGRWNDRRACGRADSDSAWSSFGSSSNAKIWAGVIII